LYRGLACHRFVGFHHHIYETFKVTLDSSTSFSTSTSSTGGLPLYTPLYLPKTKEANLLTWSGHSLNSDPFTCLPLQETLQQHKVKYVPATESQIRRGLADYLKNSLTKDTDGKDKKSKGSKNDLIELDETLALATQGSLDPRVGHTREKIFTSLSSTMQKCHITLNTATREVLLVKKTERPPPIILHVRRTGGNKHTTSITDLEGYGVGVQGLALELPKVLAVSCSVGVDSKGGGGLLVVQGARHEDLKRFLIARYEIPKECLVLQLPKKFRARGGGLHME